MLFPPAAECAGLGAYVAERQPRTSRVTLQSRQQFANQSQSPAAAVSRPDLDFFHLRRYPRRTRASLGVSLAI
jgi:hypothetical protein